MLCEGTKARKPGQSSGELFRGKAGHFLSDSGSLLEYVLGNGDTAMDGQTQSSLMELLA